MKQRGLHDGDFVWNEKNRCGECFPLCYTNFHSILPQLYLFHGTLLQSFVYSLRKDVIPARVLQAEERATVLLFTDTQP